MAAEPEQTTEAPEEATEASTGTKVAGFLFTLMILGIVGAMLAASPMAKPTLATVTLPGINQPGEQAIALEGGAHIGLGMRVDSYSYSGPDYVVVSVELLREREPVARMRCRTFELEGSSGSGSGVTQYNSDCQMTVPEGGATAIRAVASQEGEGSLTLSGITLPVYRP